METENELFYIGPSPNKGLGIFAKSKISRGQLILAEKPLVRAPMQLTATIIDDIVSKMNERDRAAFTSLHDFNSPQSSPLGIFRTNAITLGVDEESGVFACISRINHSCRPNVHHFWSESKQIELVHALKEIAPDEEIFTSYVELYAPRDERRAYLKLGFGFDCECELCAEKNQDLVTKSDNRRKNLKRLDQEILGVASFAPTTAMAKIDQLLNLLKEEGMTYEASYVGRASYDAFQIQLQTQKKNLRYWARQVVENYMIAQGEVTGRFKNEILSFYKKYNK